MEPLIAQSKEVPSVYSQSQSSRGNVALIEYYEGSQVFGLKISGGWRITRLQKRGNYRWACLRVLESFGEDMRAMFVFHGCEEYDPDLQSLNSKKIACGDVEQRKRSTRRRGNARSRPVDSFNHTSLAISAFGISVGAMFTNRQNQISSERYLSVSDVEED